MSPDVRPPLLLRRGPWRAVQVATAVAGLVVSVLLSRWIMGHFWYYEASDYPEVFPWGAAPTESTARTFGEVMGIVVLALLILPATLGVCLPWLRERLLRRP